MNEAIEVVSRLAANRSQFFDLVEQLEGIVGHNVEEQILQGYLDSNCSGCEKLADRAARAVLTAIKPIRASR